MKKYIIILLLLTKVSYGVNEIRAYYESGNTLKAVIRNTSGQANVIATHTFENWTDANNYYITMTDKLGGMYLGDFDSALPANYYNIMIYDTNIPIIYEEGYWDGTNWKSTTGQLRDIVVDTNELQTDWTDGGRLDLILDAIKKYTDLIVIVATDVNDANDAEQFTVTDGNSTADCYNNYLIMVQDATDSHWELRLIEDWATNLEITVDTDFTFTPVANDLVYIMGWQYLGNIWSRIQNLGNVTNIIDTTKDSTGGTPSANTTHFLFDGSDP